MQDIVLTVALLLACAAACRPDSASRAVPARTAQAPYLNTWMVAGPFDSDASGAGMARDHVGEATVEPGTATGGWRLFDDRLFNRNYDNYQDLFSYINLKRGESVAAKVVYAHVYLFAPAAVAAQLRMGADSEVKAWLNRALVVDHATSEPHRESIRAEVRLHAGWNRLLVKVGNRREGRLGFYCRVCALDGAAIAGLIASPGGPGGPLAVASRPMEDIGAPGMPAAYREWPYVAADALANPDAGIAGTLRVRAYQAMQASPFVLAARGGEPPYRWSLTTGKLPRGLALAPDGTITGTVSASAALGDRRLTFRVVDAAGHAATAALTMPVHERPNRWYGEAGLVGLMHGPETMLNAKPADLAEFASLMKRQGYSLGMMIAYNNGDFKYRFPNRFEPDCPYGDLAAMHKTALEKEGLRFGLYMGNLIGPNHGGDDGALLMVTDAIRKYRPAALWCDWASTDVWGYISLDALYSAIKTISPDTLIVLNGVVTCYQGDWDVICLEGWGAWGDNLWNLWPFPFEWPKKPVLESWRMIADPLGEYCQGIHPDWQAYMRLTVSLIGSGCVANLDHSATIKTPYRTLYESVVARQHRSMAEWANPPGLPPLHPSYTHVTPAPVAEAAWGYALTNAERDTLYLHCLRNPWGKTGLPAGTLTVERVRVPVVSAACMNTGRPLRFTQTGGRVSIELEGVSEDPVDTIVQLRMARSLPAGGTAAARREPVPPGNLAYGKQGRLLSVDGSHDLVPSAFAMARYALDGSMATHAQGAYEWAWMYHLDLGRAVPVGRIVIHFAARSWATEYEVLGSADGAKWDRIALVKGCAGGRQEHAAGGRKLRYVRVRAIKPDGPDQPGTQMGIAELQVFAR